MQLADAAYLPSESSWQPLVYDHCPCSHRHLCTGSTQRRAAHHSTRLCVRATRFDHTNLALDSWHCATSSNHRLTYLQTHSATTHAKAFSHDAARHGSCTYLTEWQQLSDGSQFLANCLLRSTSNFNSDMLTHECRTSSLCVH